MTVHIIGAGLAGMAAAVRLAQKGQSVIVHEATAHGGGRCRSMFDSTLDRRINNGNHLMLSGNVETMAYLRAIDSLDSLSIAKRAVFSFLDLENDERWQVKPGWLMRVPGCSVLDNLAGLKLAWAGENTTVADVFDASRAVYRKLWEPLSVSVLNTAADEASAQLLWPVLKQTFGRGEKACLPCIAGQGLSASFIGPAILELHEKDSLVQFNRRLQSLNLDKYQALSLIFGDDEVVLEADDKVILAVPGDVAGTLLPGLSHPDQFRAIVNAHFVLPEVRNDVGFLGLVGGVSQWLFVRGDVASVTVSAADDLAAKSAEEIAAILWAEISKALELKDVPIPLYRIIKEKRATFAQTPQQVRLRPGTQTRWSNVSLAGDWTATGLPATIEGAITSGHRATDVIC